MINEKRLWATLPDSSGQHYPGHLEAANVVRLIRQRPEACTDFCLHVSREWLCKEGIGLLRNCLYSSRKFDPLANQINSIFWFFLFRSRSSNGREQYILHVLTVALRLAQPNEFWVGVPSANILFPTSTSKLVFTSAFSGKALCLWHGNKVVKREYLTGLNKFIRTWQSRTEGRT
ncbi:Uncharacterized protein TCM_006041 [Theobroma cacao]|uniref:Uncharacterized protein n=1 Tax=Theobroma cacao TaxID=3641 RepID=A0A061E3P5_THECC|nr:Uncharacterized protein TCM_006041 [Theobroma cacao]